MRDNFWLIQTAKFNKDNPKFLGVKLDYMGAAEFENGAVYHSFERMMPNFDDYEFISTGIERDDDNNELMLFANQKASKEILAEFRKFVSIPYNLKRPVFIRSVLSDTKCKINFLWCIDNTDIGDWMALFKSDAESFKVRINAEHDNWLREHQKPKILKFFSTFFKKR